MKNLFKTYYKIGMVAGPLSLWIDSYVNGDDSIAKVAKDFVAEHCDNPSPVTLRVCLAASGLVTAIAWWPIFLCESLLDLFSTTE